MIGFLGVFWGYNFLDLLKVRDFSMILEWIFYFIRWILFYFLVFLFGGLRGNVVGRGV